MTKWLQNVCLKHLLKFISFDQKIKKQSELGQWKNNAFLINF